MDPPASARVVATAAADAARAAAVGGALCDGQPAMCKGGAGAGLGAHEPGK